MSGLKGLPTLRQLVYFINVADSGSFTKASIKLSVSQPPLTRQIHLLEQHLDVRLFDRSFSGISLTADGEAIYAKTKSILAEVEELSYKNCLAKENNLTIGFSCYMDPNVASTFVDVLKNSKSPKEVSLLWKPATEFIKMIKDSTVDAAIFSAPPLIIATENVIQIGEYDHVIAMSTRLHNQLIADWSLENLVSNHLFVQDLSIYPAYSRFINEAMDAISFHPRRKIRPKEMHIALSLVANDEGFMFLPSTITKFTYPGVSFVPLPEAVISKFRLPIGIGFSTTLESRNSQKLSAEILEAAKLAIAS